MDLMETITIPGYRIERELAHGGMSTVYLAVQESLGRKVALKVMAPVLAADRNFGERFLREGRTVAQFVHPNILAVHDIGSLGHSYYMAMEYVPGGDLKQRISNNRISPKQALEILRQVADALGYAHEKGFVHRDVKPENILFRENGTVVLTDFGIAKALGSGTNITGTGMTIGTAYYMSPEQAQGKMVDGRADIYSLGAVLYEMLIGQVPYEADSAVAIAVQHIQEALPELPAELSEYQPLLNRMMAKNPGDRFADAGELIVAIEALQSRKQLSSPVHEIHNADPADQQISLETQVMSTVRPPEPVKGSSLKWVIGCVVLALLVVGGIWQSQQRPQPSSNDIDTGAAATAGSAVQALNQAGVVSPGNESTDNTASRGRMNYATKRDRMPEYWLNKPWCHEGKYTEECAPAGWSVHACDSVFSEDHSDSCHYGQMARHGSCDLTGQQCFDVYGVASDDVLNVRQQPTHESEIVGKLPFDAKNVQVPNSDLVGTELPQKGWVSVGWCSTGPVEASFACNGQWLSGYVNAIYLRARNVRMVPVKWVRTPR